MTGWFGRCVSAEAPSDLISLSVIFPGVRMALEARVPTVPPVFSFAGGLLGGLAMIWSLSQLPRDHQEIMPLCNCRLSTR